MTKLLRAARDCARLRAVDIIAFTFKWSPMIDNDKSQAMPTFALLSTLLVLSGIRTAGDGLDWKFSRSPASTVFKKDIHGCPPYIEPVFHGFLQPPQRRLLEHPRRAKQVYRSYDYNVAQHRQPRNKLDEGGPYRLSAVRNNEDKDEEEEEEEEEEEDQLDENGNEETAEEDEEETVAARNRVARSGYVPFRAEADERERQDVVKIRSATEECEDEPTEPSQYYEYETEVKNVASQDARCDGYRATLGVILLILLFF